MGVASVNGASENQVGAYFGAVNMSDYKQAGFFCGVLMNEAGYQEGCYFAGAINLAVDGNQKGTYVAGVANIQVGKEKAWGNPGFKGVAVAPVNYTERSLGGLQIGLVNIAKENVGLTGQIGLINRCGNRTIPGINVAGFGYLYDAVKKRFGKSKEDV